MKKKTQVTISVDETLKSQADCILKVIGIPFSTAINMYLAQIVDKGGIPFEVSLNKRFEGDEDNVR